MATKTSKTGMLDPHKKPGFWAKPENHFWENDMYTEEGKKYLREFVKRVNKNDRRNKNGGFID